MKRFLAMMLAMTMLPLLFGSAVAELSGAEIDFPRSGITWKVPDAVRALPGRIVDKYDYGEGTRDSGVIRAYITYTEWTKEQFEAANAKSNALWAENKDTEANAVYEEIMQAAPILVFFFGIRDERYPVQEIAQMFSKDLEVKEYRDPVQIGQKGSFTFWMTAPLADSPAIKGAAKQFGEASVAALVRAQDEMMAHPEAVTLNEAASGEVYPVPGTKVSFETLDLDGNTVRSEDLFSKNKITMINYWKTYCEPCIEEMPELDRLNREYAGKGFEVVGIVDDVLNRPDFIAKAKEISAPYSIRTLQMTESVNKALYHLGTPTFYFIDSEGTVLAYPIEGAHMDQVLSGIEAYLNGNTDQVPTEPTTVSTEKQTWTLRVTDQDGNPVPGVMVTFCSNEACTMVALDENGMGSFTGPAAQYHINFIQVPQGYSAAGVADLYTDEHSGSMSVMITKE